MIIDCPYCGPRSCQEFLYRGDAGGLRPDASRLRPDMLAATAEQIADDLYLRDNPCGLHREYWFHAMGCQSWLIVLRDTLTHRIASAQLAHGEVAA